MKNYLKIRCPKCGYEYHVAEIFFPEDILGKPINIVRDDNNKIIWCEGDDSSSEEQWECYNCGTTFKVKLNIDCETVYDNKYDFSDDYTVTKNTDKEILF